MVTTKKIKQLLRYVIIFSFLLTVLGSVVLTLLILENWFKEIYRSERDTVFLHVFHMCIDSSAIPKHPHSCFADF